MSEMSQIGYWKAIAPQGSGFRASVSDCFCFYDTNSAHAAYRLAVARAGKCDGKVTSWFSALVGYDLRQQYASIEPVGKGIGEWEPEMEAAAS